MMSLYIATHIWTFVLCLLKRVLCSLRIQSSSYTGTILRERLRHSRNSRTQRHQEDYQKWICCPIRNALLYYLCNHIAHAEIIVFTRANSINSPDVSACRYVEAPALQTSAPKLSVRPKTTRYCSYDAIT